MIWLSVLLLLALLVLVLLVINYYVDWKSLPWYAIPIIILSWWFPFSLPVILPLDLASTQYDKHCNSTTIHSALETQGFHSSIYPHDTNTYINQHNYSHINTCDRPPLAYIHSHWLFIYWKTLYWSMFCMTWFIIPTMITWIRRGETRFSTRLWKSFRENLLFNFALFSVGVSLALYAFFFKNFTWSNLTAVGMAAANAWGLLLVIFMMGFGLVEIPKGLWYKSDPKWRFYHTAFQIPEFRDKYIESKEKFLECATEIVFASRNTQPNTELMDMLNVIAHRANIYLSDPQSVSFYLQRASHYLLYGESLEVNYVELLKEFLRKGIPDVPLRELNGANLVERSRSSRRSEGSRSSARLWEETDISVLVDVDEKYISGLNARLKRVKLRYLRAKAIYDKYRFRASFYKDILDNKERGLKHNNDYSSNEERRGLLDEEGVEIYSGLFVSAHTTPRLLNTSKNEIEFSFFERIRLRILWWWYCVLRMYVLRAVSIFLIVMSVVVCWSESTFQITNPVLSIPAIIFNKTSDIGYAYLEIFSVLFLGYMCICTFLSLFKVKFFDYKLVGNHSTDTNSALWIGGYLCKLTFSLCYNFLRLVQDETSVFTRYQGRSASLTPLLGKGYNKWLPLAIFFISLITFFNSHGRILRKFEINKYFHEPIDYNDANMAVIDDGSSETNSWRYNSGYAIGEY